jgi:transcriptional regulator with PAS, ATPase and Fis domain
MSSAIEVLESEKVLYIEKIKEIESRFNGMPFDIKESYQKSVKVYQEFIDALDEAIVALEKQEKLKEWLDDTERLAKQSNKYYLDKNGVNIFGKQDYYSARIKTIKEIKKILERVGEQK